MIWPNSLFRDIISFSKLPFLKRNTSQSRLIKTHQHPPQTRDFFGGWGEQLEFAFHDRKALAFLCRLASTTWLNGDSLAQNLGFGPRRGWCHFFRKDIGCDPMGTSLAILSQIFKSLEFIWMFPKIGGVPPQIIHFSRVFHYKPSISGYPYFWKHPLKENCDMSTSGPCFHLHPQVGSGELWFWLTFIDGKTPWFISCCQKSLFQILGAYLLT